MAIRVQKGDTVVLTTGKDGGKKGKVLKVFPKTERVLVEGINFLKKHTKPNQKNQKGGIIEKEGAVHASNVLPFCSNCQKGVRVGVKKLKDNTTSRFCKHCKETIGKN